ncbi:substrate-binding periplasmic protein [Thalassospira marina]|uniref:Solute-binding protein family 3/N-terminal domain-containing protein n=1 Tax=Thalassospira marina TaxID=2048283 RepID=A0A2N3KX77_9PROT|nr:transporter substrate-binding domain-containing protein [Thalassospira marina]AUG53995.1 hypothetical protein CSC3H3_15655 [Thalassospira marina]PKR55128.1 hypothetical protein COO20_07040 [Thalassospira marina]
MSMRPALVFLLLLGVFLIHVKPVSAQAENSIGTPRQRVVLYGEENDPPYAYLNGAVMAGAYTDILRQAAMRLPQYEIEFAGVPFKRGMEMLQRGEIMAFYPPYMDAERDWVDRYSEAILDESVVVLCTRQFVSHRTLLSYPFDYIGARFGNTSGYRLAGKDLFEMADRHEITLEEAHSTEINLRRLLAGRIDCYVNDRLAIATSLGEIGTETIEVRRELTETAVLGRHQGAIAYTPDDTAKWPHRDEFAAALDIVLRQMHEDGVIDQILQHYVMY